MTTILVVDDEPAIALVLRLLLEDAGYTVETAANGAAALAAMATRRPALVVCDLMMPQMSGNEVYAQMQADPALQAVPVVLLSAAAEPAITPGANYAGFVRKPFDSEHLLQIVQAVLEPPRAE